MPRLLKSIVLICWLAFFCATGVFAAEQITITSYYPSPFGVYNELQLYAHDPAATVCDNAHKGTMYYNASDDYVYICKGALGWLKLGENGWTWETGKVYTTVPTDNVGIGDSTPSALLTVGSGDAFQVTSTGLVRGPTGAVASPTYSFTADTNTGIYRGGADILRFVTAGSDRMTIDAAGRVGIGTTSPSYKLHIHDTANAYFKISSDNTYSFINFAPSNSETWYIRAKTNELSLGLFTGGEVITLKPTLNVGVGTQTPDPAARLEVAGKIKITGGFPGSGKVLTSDAGGLAAWGDIYTATCNLGPGVGAGCFATCAGNDVVVGGGYHNAAAADVIIDNYPSGNNRWRCQVWDTTGVATCYARCLTVP